MITTDSARELRDELQRPGYGSHQWTIDPDAYVPTLVRDTDGLRFYLTTDRSRPGRIVARGTFNISHAYMPHGVTYTQISVDGARGVEVLAREITRRLIPAHELEHVRVHGIATANHERETATRANRDRFGKLLGHPGDNPRVFAYWPDTRTSVRVDPSADTARLELDLPVDLAETVVQLIIDRQGRP